MVGDSLPFLGWFAGLVGCVGVCMWEGKMVFKKPWGYGCGFGCGYHGVFGWI